MLINDIPTKIKAAQSEETVEILERVVIEENAECVILAGEEIIIALLLQRMPAQIADKVIDILRLDIRTPEHEILKAAIESLQENNAQSDAEKVRDLFDQYRADGLAVKFIHVSSPSYTFPAENT